MPKTINNKKRAAKLLSEGDKLLKKSRFKEALKKYKKARKYDPERPDIYDRLIRAHDKSTGKWSEKDVVESVGWLMEKQEIENPSLKLLHAKLSPEWKSVADKIETLITCDNEDDEYRIIEEIRAFNAAAIYPLIYTILQIKKGLFGKKDEECHQKNE